MLKLFFDVLTVDSIVPTGTPSLLFWTLLLSVQKLKMSDFLCALYEWQRETARFFDDEYEAFASGRF